MNQKIVMAFVTLMLLVFIGCSQLEQSDINSSIAPDKNIELKHSSKKYVENDVLSAVTQGKAIANNTDATNIFYSNYQLVDESALIDSNSDTQIFFVSVSTPYRTAVDSVAGAIEADVSYTIDDVREVINNNRIKLNLYLVSNTKLTNNNLDISLSYDGNLCEKGKAPYLAEGSKLLDNNKYGQFYIAEWFCFNDIYDKKANAILSINGKETSLSLDMILYR